MFREMRRNRQQLPEAEALEILNRATSGVLALSGDDGYPYAVPMSFVYHDDKIYFHSALSGHKVDAVKGCGKASFCVIGRDQVLPEKYTTAFKSVIAFGKIRLISDEEKKYQAALLLCEKYNPGHPEASCAEAVKGAGRMCILELSIEHLTGKEGLELTRRRKQD